MKSVAGALCAGLLILFSFSNCARKSAALTQSSMALNAALNSQASALQLLDEMSAQANRADSSRRINHTTNEDIQRYVDGERKKIEEITVKMRSAQADIDEFNNEATSKKEAEILANANRLVFESSAMLRILEDKTKVIVAFLNSETFSKSEIGALFKPGEYRLIREQMREGKRLFSPIVEKLFVFAEKYKGVFSSLKGQIIVTGYSDATPVEPGSVLYKDLSSRLASVNGLPEQPDLNRKLSELRAEAVKELLEGIIEERKTKYPGLMDISLQTLGRGEEVPPGIPLEVSKNDRRRRVVTFYWVVLPTM